MPRKFLVFEAPNNKKLFGAFLCEKRSYLCNHLIKVRMKQQEVFLKRGVYFPGGPIGLEPQIKPGFYKAEIRDGFAYLEGVGRIGVTLDWVEFRFNCPIDKRVKLYLSGLFLEEVPHCTTTKDNNLCPFIKAGCIGCRFDKEQILRANEI